MDRRTTLFLLPAVSLTALVFAAVSAGAKPWGRIRSGRTAGAQRR